MKHLGLKWTPFLQGLESSYVFPSWFEEGQLVRMHSFPFKSCASLTHPAPKNVYTPVI